MEEVWEMISNVRGNLSPETLSNQVASQMPYGMDDVYVESAKRISIQEMKFNLFLLKCRQLYYL